tara:strand:+ start:274 stop:1251 length:978 start_codon:yes stop_codon:yes gene_type:complete
VPNPIKYNASTETLALKKGNFWIGTGDVGKGPTNVTGYYNGITPPAGGFTIYLNKETSGPSIYTVSTEAQLVSLTNTIGAQSFTTSGECLNWFATQTDKMVFNIDYPAIITDGLIFNVDAGFTPSYPGEGTTWYDLTGSVNGTLTNGPTFDQSNGGSIVFDGVDDYVNTTNSVFGADVTYNAWVNRISSVNTINMFMGKGSLPYFGIRSTNNIIFSNRIESIQRTLQTPLTSPDNTWYYLSFTQIYDGTNTTMIIYINGVLANSAIFSGISQTSTSTSIFTIGGRTAGDIYPFNGKVSQVSIYNRALSASEILQNYNAQKSRFGL